MALIEYRNYEIPLAGGFGQNVEPSWIRRNWPTVLQILGYVFVVGGVIAKQVVDKTVPPGKIAVEDWEMIIQQTEKLNPHLSRQQVIQKLCDLFGARAPFCADMAIPSLRPPGSEITPVGREEGTIAGLPVWIVLIGGVAAAFLFLK